MNYIKSIQLLNEVDKSIYPYNIPAFQNGIKLNLNTPVTFFAGENGSGKSTLLEALAVFCKINPEGGSQNFHFKTCDSHSSLADNLILSKSLKQPTTKYFLRAESFYNVATEIDRALKEDLNAEMFYAHGGKSFHQQSHGESFITLVENRFYPGGLYLLDEPEAALSPIKQMKLLILIDNLVKKGSQFIIATHSPILLSYQNAEILDFDHNLTVTSYKETNAYQLYKLFLDNPDQVLSKLFPHD